MPGAGRASRWGATGGDGARAWPRAARLRERARGREASGRTEVGLGWEARSGGQEASGGQEESGGGGVAGAEAGGGRGGGGGGPEAKAGESGPAFPPPRPAPPSSGPAFNRFRPAVHTAAIACLPGAPGEGSCHLSRPGCTRGTPVGRVAICRWLRLYLPVPVEGRLEVDRQHPGAPPRSDSEPGIRAAGAPAYSESPRTPPQHTPSGAGSSAPSSPVPARAY